MTRTPNRTTEPFVERMGLAAEADGFPRIAGRLFGALIMSDAPCSLDDLAESLGVSKASVSTDARRLLERHVVERVSKPGDRRDYYQLAPDFLARLVEHRVARWAALRDLASDVRRDAARLPAAVRDRLDYVDAFHAFVLSRIEGALEEWEAQHAAQEVAP